MIKEGYKAIFLILIIILLSIIMIFILDFFSLIKAEQYLGFLNRNEKLINSEEEQNKVWTMELDKKNKILDQEKVLIEEEKIRLNKKEIELENKMNELEEIQKGILQREKELEEKEKEKESREVYVNILANKIANMPPQDAVDMLEKWSDEDIIDVFMQMDRNSEAEGVDSITSFLLTLLPKDRSSNLTQKWLKNSVRFSDKD